MTISSDEVLAPADDLRDGVAGPLSMEGGRRGRASHLSPEALANLRRRLLSNRQHIMAEVTALRDHEGDDGDDWDRLLCRRDLDIKLSMLNEINAALDRMSRHTYGICEASNQPIPLTRLEDIPWARSL